MRASGSAPPSTNREFVEAALNLAPVCECASLRAFTAHLQQQRQADFDSRYADACSYWYWIHQTFEQTNARG